MKLLGGAAVLVMVITGSLTGHDGWRLAGPSTAVAPIVGISPVPHRPVGGEEWDGLVGLGDRYLTEGSAEARARESYLAAFARARQRQSLDGLIHVAEAFAALGDPDMVRKVLRVAQAVAASDPEGRADVRAAAARLLVGGPGHDASSEE